MANIKEDICSSYIFADSNYLFPSTSVSYIQVTMKVHTKEQILSLLKLIIERVI